MSSNDSSEFESLIPDVDAIRAAIAATDERARLLRQLLRLAIRMKLNVVSDNNRRNKKKLDR